MSRIKHHHAIIAVSILLTAITVIFPTTISASSAPPQHIIVNFAPGQKTPSNAETNKFLKVFDKLNLSGDWKILVEGHTDANGNHKKNNTLSLKRAEAVKRLLIKKAGLDADRIFTRGAGERSPIANNRSTKGRARNRRVEIALITTTAWPEHVRDAVIAPKLPEIHRIIKDAQTLAKKGRWNEALSQLMVAKKNGGDRISEWHTTYGIIGFHQGVPDHRVKSILKKAVALKPFNTEAREYLARINAKENVKTGKISPLQGRSADAPIQVTTASQQYEYMRLFKVTPIMKMDSPAQAVDVWKCTTTENETVFYYFDHSSQYRWIFR